MNKNRFSNMKQTGVINFGKSAQPRDLIGHRLAIASERARGLTVIHNVREGYATLWTRGK